MTNVAPLVTAAREGAVHAARAASRERARVRPTLAWWRRRGFVVTAATVVVVGAMGGVYAMLAGRQNSFESAGDGSGMRSSVDAGRERVAGAAKTVMDRVRRDNGAGPREGAMASAVPDRSQGDRPITGTG